MKNKRVFVYGAGGHGKVVANILVCSNTAGLTGFIDDRGDLQGTTVLGLPVLGNGSWLQATALSSPVVVVLGVGENSARQLLARRCMSWKIDILTAIHPNATVARTATVGPGTVVMARAVINPGANVGAGAVINSAAVVEHDVEVGDFAHVAPNATMGGGSRLGALSLLGMGAVLLQRITVGEQSFIGAGAVVTRNIPNGVVAVGIPARVKTHPFQHTLPLSTLTLTD